MRKLNRSQRLVVLIAAVAVVFSVAIVVIGHLLASGVAP